jgi:exosortase/archaeosortase family protein
VAEVLNFFGEPAKATGTVIEVGPGFIGIDEACGGIRSLQTAVLVALAVGELRRDRWLGRVGWLGFGVGLALVANTLRIGALAIICSRSGFAALGLWHGRVAVLEMVFTLGILGFVAVRIGLAPQKRGAAPSPAAESVPPRSAAALAAIILATIALTEVGTLAWFGTGIRPEVHGTPRWTARLPEQLPSFSGTEFTPVMQQLLQCDTHQLGSWRDASGAHRAGFVLEWHRGHFAQYAVRLHTPDVCLSLAGSELIGSRPPLIVEIGPLRLPFFIREFRRGGQRYTVYFLPWNVSSGKPLSLVATPDESSKSWLRRQWEEVRARRRSLEAQEVAIAIYDVSDPAEADQAFRAQIAQVVHLD